MLDFAEMFFFDEQMNPIELTFPRFMELILDLRASNTATLKDLMNLGKQLTAKSNAMHKAIDAGITNLRDAMMKALAETKAGQKKIQEQLGGTVEILAEDNPSAPLH